MPKPVFVGHSNEFHYVSIEAVQVNSVEIESINSERGEYSEDVVRTSEAQNGKAGIFNDDIEIITPLKKQ